MSKYHSGKWRPKNKDKYRGNIDNITYRSSWEKAMLNWCDNSPSIVKYSSEELVIPYVYDLDKTYHRYFVDFVIELKDGTKIAIEIKPKKETSPPLKGKNRNRYITESLTYVKNQNKWEAATKYCKTRNMKFEVWTEVTLKAKGILPKSIKPIRPLRNRKKKP